MNTLPNAWQTWLAAGLSYQKKAASGKASKKRFANCLVLCKQSSGKRVCAVCLSSSTMANTPVLKWSGSLVLLAVKPKQQKVLARLVIQFLHQTRLQAKMAELFLTAQFLIPHPKRVLLQAISLTQLATQLTEVKVWLNH